MTSIEKLNSLLNQLEYKLEHSAFTPDSKNDLRQENLHQIYRLFKSLGIDKKHHHFKSIFNYKAINLAGIALKDENFAEIHEGRYIQIISIAYEVNSTGKQIVKNTSLGYYGKAEKIEPQLKNDIIEFVLRWRYEKSFQQSDHYQELISRL